MEDGKSDGLSGDDFDWILDLQTMDRLFWRSWRTMMLGLGKSRRRGIKDTLINMCSARGAFVTSYAQPETAGMSGAETPHQSHAYLNLSHVSAWTLLHKVR